MALDFSLSESCIGRSIRRFFVETFQTGKSISVFFDMIERVPNIDRWLSVKIESIDLDTMATAYIQVFCFVRKDLDYVELSTLRDLVYEELIDLDQTTGMARIPLYDAAWAIVGYAVFQPQNDIGATELDDGTLVKILPVNLRWGAK